MRQRHTVVVLLCCLLIGSVMLPTAGATAPAPTADDSHLHFDIDSNGDATITLVSVYPVTDADEYAAFESLKSDTDAQDELRDRFIDRLDSVTEQMDAGGTVSDGSISIELDDDVARIEIAAVWDSFATHESGAFTVTEPIGSGFTTEYPLVITVPDGWTIESVSPEPDSTNETIMKWDAATDLSGFELHAHDDTDDNQLETMSDDALPGFGLLAGIAALVGVLGIRQRLHA